MMNKFYFGDYVSSKHNPECVYKVVKMNEHTVDLLVISVSDCIYNTEIIHKDCNPDNLYRVGIRIQIQHKESENAQ